jgi:hypothetical protein
VNPWWIAGGVTAGLAGSLGWFGWNKIRDRGLDQWIFEYFRTRHLRFDPDPEKPCHLLLCIADHYEPNLDGADEAIAQARIQRWLDDYPKLFDPFRDADGKPPQHTFFYPIETYQPRHLDQLAELCKQGFGEVEVHLHHHNDTAENLRLRLLEAKQTFSEKHGLLSQHRETGETGYAFIHGDWALDNSRRDGRCCGVHNELSILRETGCFVDMTMPSAPSSTQTRQINSIYRAVGRPGKTKSHQTGVRLQLSSPSPPAGEGLVQRGESTENALLLIQGPLLFDSSRKKLGLIPQIENACLQGNQAPSESRLKLWLRARVQVSSRPDWFFAKLHTHGANEKNMPVLLGEPMVRFHQHLADRAKANPNFHVHYVTAREMTNLALAAEAGFHGEVQEARDWVWRTNLT